MLEPSATESIQGFLAYFYTMRFFWSVTDINVNFYLIDFKS